MSDLDKKLGSIIDDIANKANSQGLKGLAFTWGVDYQEQIKQAFGDAGWIPEEVAKKSIRVERVYPAFDSNVSVYAVDSKPLRKQSGLERYGAYLMTGQEWYDRFIKQMGESATHCDGCSCDAIEAARKAAGLE